MDWSFDANGKHYTVRERTGSVVDVQIWSETHVSGSSSGGGGYINNGTGYVSSPSVSVTSTVQNRQRLFVNWNSGSEGTIELDDSVPFRVGNKVREVFVVGASSAPRIEILNLDTGHWLRNRGYYERKMPRMTVVGIIVSALIGALVHWLVLSGGIVTMVIVAALAVLVYAGLKWVARIGRVGENREVREFWAAFEKSRPREREAA